MTPREQLPSTEAGRSSKRRSSAPPQLWQEAYQRILERILRGDFPLGAPLCRRTLASEFRMSLLPVSEALRRLELDGLVEVQARAGTRVRIPSPQDVEEHIIVRTALECESARLFCERATREEREDILARAEHLDYLRTSSSNLAVDKELAYIVHSCHMEFHQRIADVTRCGALRALIEKNQILTLNWLYDTASGNESFPARFHTDLAQTLVGNNPNKAEEAMRAHVPFGREWVVREFEARYWKDVGSGSAQRNAPGRQFPPKQVRRWRNNSPVTDKP